MSFNQEQNNVVPFPGREAIIRQMIAKLTAQAEQEELQIELLEQEVAEKERNILNLEETVFHTEQSIEEYHAAIERTEKEIELLQEQIECINLINTLQDETEKEIQEIRKEYQRKVFRANVGLVAFLLSLLFGTGLLLFLQFRALENPPTGTDSVEDIY